MTPISIDEERAGWSKECPKCGMEIRFTILNLNMASKIEPFMYCNSCSDIILRDEDEKALHEIIGNSTMTLGQLRAFYLRLEKEAPKCLCGGHFRIWANFKCPQCNWEFPYNNGIKSEQMRYFESKIIWIEGATVYRGENQNNNRLAKVKIDSARINQ